MALVLLALGAVLTVAGSALIAWKAAVVVAGVILIAAGVDLSRDRP